MNIIKNKEGLCSLLLLNRLGLGRYKEIHEFLRATRNPAELVRRIEEENFLDRAEALKELRGVFNPERELERVYALGIKLINTMDENYPFLLRQISDPPILLYVKGDFLESDRVSVSIVGTRHPSLYGMRYAKKFSEELSAQGITIVSGFAKGIDQIAHEAALIPSCGRTLAVLGCGLNVNYPKNSEKIFEKITRKGAVISEYALDTPPLSENFPKRNRIIAGLSLGSLVIEAHSRSGSLITARLALEEGREVFSLPGSVDQLTSRGTHQLIKEGALLVESSDEIAKVIITAAQTHQWIRSETLSLNSGCGEDLNQKISGEQGEFFSDTKTGKDAAMELPEIHQKILQCLRSARGLLLEELYDLPMLKETGPLTVILTELELKNLIRREKNGSYVKL